MTLAVSVREDRLHVRGTEVRVLSGGEGEDTDPDAAIRYGQEAWGDGYSWEGNVPRVAKDVPDRVARLKAIGNGQVPLVAAMAWLLLADPEE